MSFDTTPDPYFLHAMRSQSWNVTGALAELVDNSFGPGRGNADLCEITYDPRKRMVTIVDDGVGMSSIGRLFQLGNTIGRTPGDIGLYGSGGTMAILWLADAVAVYTLRDGKVSHDRVVWAEWIARHKFPQIDDSWHTVSLSNCPPELLVHGHGTAIVFKLAPERGKLRTDNVRRDLAKIYGPGIRAGKQIVWTTLGKGGDSETLVDPIVMPGDQDKVINFDFALEYDGDVLPVTGQVGLVDGLKISDAGIHVGYGSRVITKTKDCFVSVDGNEKYAGASVTGWLDLGDGWQPYLSTTKTAVNDKPLWEALMGYVFESIKPLLEESDDEKLSLELEDIRLSLQNLFDGRATVSVPRTPSEVPTDLPEGPGDEGTASAEEPATPETDESDQHVDRPAKAEIRIVPSSDEELDGVLCFADRAASTVTVYVNKDHPLIDLALQQRPVNRMLLNQVVVNEIANVLADDPQLCDVAFKKSVATTIAEIEDPQQRERKVLRLLTDNIKAKQAS
jgi:Histidine kinase-, DNA gyrase B-, and HSP90-like ATPase